jgi:hypothetical protein
VSYEDKVKPRLKSALVPVTLGTVGGLVVGGIPGIVLAVLSGFVLLPSDVKRYYQEIHQAFLSLNDTIAKVKGTPCWSDLDLQQWRSFRDSWAKFYGEGPSTTWLLFGDDFKRAGEYAEGLVTWRQKVIAQCAPWPEPAPKTSGFVWFLVLAGAAGIVYMYYRPQLRARNWADEL